MRYENIIYVLLTSFYTNIIFEVTLTYFIIYIKYPEDIMELNFIPSMGATYHKLVMRYEEVLVLIKLQITC